MSLRGLDCFMTSLDIPVLHQCVQCKYNLTCFYQQNPYKYLASNNVKFKIKPNKCFLLAFQLHLFLCFLIQFGSEGTEEELVLDEV